MTEQSGDGGSQAAIEILLNVVLPVGAAMIAFSQLPGVESSAVAIALLSVATIGLFVGFRSTINMADRKLNGGVA